MNPRVFATICGAILLGLAAGHLVTKHYLPWQLPAGLLIVGLVIAVWSIREQLRLAVATKSVKQRSQG